MKQLKEDMFSVFSVLLPFNLRWLQGYQNSFFLAKFNIFIIKKVKFNAFLNPLKKCQKIMGKSYQ
jgi:hypothetical protein